MTKLTRRGLMAMGAAVALFPMAAFAASVPAPEPGKGLIVFYRGGSTAGNAVRFDIADQNGNIVAHMQRGAVQPVSVSPGAHEFSVPDANNTSGVIDIKAGETIFIESYIDAATFAGKLQFRVVPEKRALKTIGKM
ncbi:hypothetical protein FAP39_06095 [Shimia litoralis]|uniref:DUF2846 domain-containing protein n=1 Tax=Shimia litoralis TaxID=420403 RepID=A0A4V6F232_9RHOB|nr:hypothetical protein [Shimia litoralis]TKZ21311.1 hypothetical protein FAP39_06095 [Shimia litoralis]